MSEESISFSSLPESEQSILMQFYGKLALMENNDYNDYRIEDIRTLSDAEQKVFDSQGGISPHFTVQTLYKVRGDIAPIHFNLMLHRLLEMTPELRSNFCVLPKRVLKVVFHSRKEQPEVTFRMLTDVDPEDVDQTLQRLMDADMRKGFDLSHGPLLRFLVLRTRPGEYAILMTALQIVANSFSVHNFLRAVQKLEPLAVDTKYSLRDYLASLGGALAAPVMGYWKKVLEDLPPRPMLPNMQQPKQPYEQKSYRIMIPQPDMDALDRQASSNRNMMMSILQTTWGMMLRSVNRCKDTYFCILASDRGTAGVGENSAVNMFPVRLACEDSDIVQSVLSKQFQQLVVSRPYSRIRRELLVELMGRGAGDIQHFLSFRDFVDQELKFHEHAGSEDGALVAKNSWDAQGIPLGIYFHLLAGSVAITFLYDKNSFQPLAIEGLAKQYLLILHNLLMNAENPVSAVVQGIESGLRHVEESAEPAAAAVQSITEFLLGTEFFKGCKSVVFERMCQNARISTYFESDQLRVSPESSSLLFIVEGSVVRNMDPGTGWFSMLDVAKAGRVINELILLPDNKHKIFVEVMSEQAKILSIPLPYVQDLLQFNSEVQRRFFLYALREMGKYQRRWVAS